MMKPSEEQKQQLKVQLGDWLQFRETHLEVYDHVLTALEQRSPGERSDDPVNETIYEDFGGWEQLQEMEQTAFDSTTEACYKKYRQYLAMQITGRELFITMAMSIGVYLLVSRAPQAALPVGVISVFGIFSPYIINWYRRFRQKYLFKDNKPSIKDVAFRITAVKSIRLYWALGVPINVFGKQFIPPQVNIFVLILFFMIGWVYLRAFSKLYRDEIKITVIA